MKEHQKYSTEQRENALQRVALRSNNQTIESIAALVDVNVGTLKNWMKEAKKQSANAGVAKPCSAYTPAQQQVRIQYGAILHLFPVLLNPLLVHYLDCAS